MAAAATPGSKPQATGITDDTIISPAVGAGSVAGAVKPPAFGAETSGTDASAAPAAAADSIWTKREEKDSVWSKAEPKKADAKEPAWAKRDEADPIWPKRDEADPVWPKRDEKASSWPGQDDKDSAWPKSRQLPTPPTPRTSETQPAMPIPQTPAAASSSGGVPDWTPSFSPTGQGLAPAAARPSASTDATARGASSLAALAKKAKLPGGAKPGNGASKLASAARAGGAASLTRVASVKAKAKPRPMAQAVAGSQGAGQPRDARLVLTRIEPWAMMRFTFMISLIGFVVMFVAVTVLYFVLSALGVFTQIETTFGLVSSSKGSSGNSFAHLFSAPTVLGYTLMAGAIDVVLITMLVTVGAMVYNLVTRLAGGIEITLQEAE